MDGNAIVDQLAHPLQYQNANSVAHLCCTNYAIIRYRCEQLVPLLFDRFDALLQCDCLDGGGIQVAQLIVENDAILGTELVHIVGRNDCRAFRVAPLKAKSGKWVREWDCRGLLTQTKKVSKMVAVGQRSESIASRSTAQM